jgi:hypothetical protein|tara:strand:+ start:181 stop:561 length:381 start_codon:yes stop_codon:yes gene_type:complete
MSEMKYCQGPKCHEYRTKDRIRGSKGDKHYQTRKRSSFYYLGNNACSMQCERDWYNKFGEMALNHFGRTTEAKRTGCDAAWYKDYDYSYNPNGSSRINHRFVNDLLGERRPITEEQYNNKDLVRPN